MAEKVGAQKRKLIEILREELPDHRTGNAIHHELGDIVMIGLLSILCNSNTFVGMVIFGEEHEAVLRQFLSLPHGIPSHDTFGHVFARLNPGSLAICFQRWMDEIRGEMESHHVAIDGKTIRGSGRNGQRAKHVITAFASEARLVLGNWA